MIETDKGFDGEGRNSKNNSRVFISNRLRESFCDIWRK